MPPRSKIAQLPEEVRRWLHRAFVERAFGDIVAITEELNAKLREGNIAVYVGKSAVGAESQKVQRAQEAIRATTEAAKLIADASADQSDARSEAAMAMVQSQVFELLLQMREASDEVDPGARLKLMATVAKSVSTLSRARVNQAKWRDEVEAKAKAAADKVATLAKKGGASPETIRQIRESILGIVKREPRTESQA
jgi:hypothetical protein